MSYKIQIIKSKRQLINLLYNVLWIVCYMKREHERLKYGRVLKQIFE